MALSLSAEQSVEHYENFPVASWLLPKRYRPSVMALYRFARAADDIADEGDDEMEVRQQKLAALLASFERQLTHSIDSSGDPWHSITSPLAKLCHEGLPVDYPRDLISAFHQDTHTKRYRDMAELFDYARRSANPVGRSLLFFFGCHQEPALRQSDAICTALQLINFWQDVAIDWQKDRIYIPADYLKQFQFDDQGNDSIARFVSGEAIDQAWIELTHALVEHSRALMKEGAPLPRTIGGRAGFELQAVIEGGLRILEKVAAVKGDVFRHRPMLSKTDGFLMFGRALWHF